VIIDPQIAISEDLNSSFYWGRTPRLYSYFSTPQSLVSPPEAWFHSLLGTSNLPFASIWPFHSVYEASIHFEHGKIGMVACVLLLQELLVSSVPHCAMRPGWSEHCLVPGYLRAPG